MHTGDSGWVEQGYRIGEPATLTGLTPDALRFYERQGLLDRSARTPGRFRIYPTSAIERVRFIKRAQVLGFTLSEIQELVQFNGKGGLKRCRRVRGLLKGQLAEVDTRLAELTALRETRSSSSPSVRFTALDAATRTSMANGT